MPSRMAEMPKSPPPEAECVEIPSRCVATDEKALLHNSVLQQPSGVSRRMKNVCVKNTLRRVHGIVKAKWKATPYKELFTGSEQGVVAPTAKAYEWCVTIMSFNARINKIRGADKRLEDAEATFGTFYKMLPEVRPSVREIFASEDLIDPVALHYLSKYNDMDCQGRRDLVPCRSSSNGHCFYNSVSIALFGGEEAAAEIRFRSVVEFAANKEYYTRHLKNVNAYMSGASYLDLHDVTHAKSWASQMIMPATAQAMGCNIRVVHVDHPNMHGLPRYYREAKYTPVSGEAARTVAVAHVCSIKEEKEDAFRANHFVPLLRREASKGTPAEKFTEPCRPHYSDVRAVIQAQMECSDKDLKHILQVCDEIEKKME